MNPDRTLPWDWYAGRIPENVELDESVYIETSFSFHCFRSHLVPGVTLARGASTYLGTMFDVGPRGRVVVGEYSLIHGARIICDSRITIGNCALISWNVVLMDTYRVPLDPRERRHELEKVPTRQPRYADGAATASPIDVGANVWIGFDSCILPGVHIGPGSIVGARSVVSEDVPPYTIVAGNPARIIRRLVP